MTGYFLVKLVHIISSTILFGTGIGIAFFMFRSLFANNINAKYDALDNTVMADFIFTLPAVIIQPITGFWLVLHQGYAWNAPWLLWSYFLFCFVGSFWIPVVFIQIKLKNIVLACLNQKVELPSTYYRLFRLWFYLGIPAFLIMIAMFYLMIAKPS